jgi:hypothetical protein
MKELLIMNLGFQASEQEGSNQMNNIAMLCGQYEIAPLWKTV